MDILRAAKELRIEHNVSLRVLDPSGNVVQTHTGHNAVTASMLTGIGHYLSGDGVLNQGEAMLSRWIPRYISLGTMGLWSQDQDEEGLPTGIGLRNQGTEEDRFIDYATQTPGFGADGSDRYRNNDREEFGLGPMYAGGEPVKCELISPSFPRAQISYRDVVPEGEAELPQTVDIVFSALVSTGALAQFRNDRDYVFITEAGLWSTNYYTPKGDNGLLAGFRIMPPDREHWDMRDPANREILRRQILKVKRNQVVQVIWKIQLGGIDDVAGIEQLYSEKYKMKWWRFDGQNLTPTE